MPEIRKYLDSRGACPLDDWLTALRDGQGRARIQIQLDRLAIGLEGNWKSVGDGVRELRIPTGPGYRVYYAWDGAKCILLLCGGDKSSQPKDVTKAKSYWRDYRGE